MVVRHLRSFYYILLEKSNPLRYNELNTYILASAVYYGGGMV